MKKFILKFPDRLKDVTNKLTGNFVGNESTTIAATGDRSRGVVNFPRGGAAEEFIYTLDEKYKNDINEGDYDTITFICDPPAEIAPSEKLENLDFKPRENLLSVTEEDSTINSIFVNSKNDLERNMKSPWFEMEEQSVLEIVELVSSISKDKAIISYPIGCPIMIVKMLCGSRPDLFIPDKNLPWNSVTSGVFDNVDNFKQFCKTCKNDKILTGAKTLMKMLMSLNGFPSVTKCMCDAFIAQSIIKVKGTPLPNFKELEDFVISSITDFTGSESVATRLVRNFSQVLNLIRSEKPIYAQEKAAEAISHLNILSLSDDQILQEEMRTETVKVAVQEDGPRGKKITKMIEKKHKRFPKVRVEVKMTTAEEEFVARTNEEVNNHVRVNLAHIEPMERRKFVSNLLSEAYNRTDRINQFLMKRRKEIIDAGKKLQDEKLADKSGTNLLKEYYLLSEKEYKITETFIQTSSE